MSARSPRFSFGMIVFNGDFFLKQCLDGVYDFAHEIIIVEGADEISRPFAGVDGASTDGTVAVIGNYPDPKQKIKLIRGAFKDKDEQSNAYMRHVTGDFVWLLDSDEMYQPADMERIAKELHDDPELMAVQMRHHVFFGGLERVARGGHWLNTFWRIHRLHPGAKYLSHRPVNIMHPSGKTLNEMKHISADFLDGLGIRMYHYSYVLDRQVDEKIRYHCHWRPTIYPIEKDIHRFRYDYMEKVWQPWKRGSEERERVEREFGLSPVIYRDKLTGELIRDWTEPFAGKHPPALRSHPLWRQTFSELRRCA